MKSFLLNGKKPLVKWGLLPDGILFKGKVPEGFNLAVCPSSGTIVIDVDRHGKLDGFTNIPEHLKAELDRTLNYPTKNQGRHYWFKYSGNRVLANKASGLGIDLRTHNGYVVWYPKKSLKKSMKLVNTTSTLMNTWLEGLFGYVKDRPQIKQLEIKF